MLKSLYKEINWNRVGAIGFDLDGTLYDEKEFISQVYQDISCYIGKLSCHKQEIIYRYMLREWIQYGSSYYHIFENTLEKFCNKKIDLNNHAKSCLDIFRNFSPNISLSPGNKRLLDNLKGNYPLFLITDGKPKLQNKKIKSLKLSIWFDKFLVCITGSLEGNAQKPSRKSFDHLDLKFYFKDDKEIIYFGDRQIDYEFCKNTGMRFIQINSGILG